MQRPAPAGTRGAPLSGEEGAGAGLYPLHLPIARGGQAGTALGTSLPPPSPAGLQRSLEFFYPLFPSVQKRLTPNPELFCCTQQESSLQGPSAGVDAWAAATADSQ